MKTRAAYRMVGEDDPQWQRFWDAYPKRFSKKDARKAWASLNPSPAVVDQMIDALAWQVPLHRWDGDKYDFAPYPASWLNARRWEDERPRSARPAMAAAQAPVPAWMESYCLHQPTCRETDDCKRKRAQETLIP